MTFQKQTSVACRSYLVTLTYHLHSAKRVRGGELWMASWKQNGLNNNKKTNTTRRNYSTNGSAIAETITKLLYRRGSAVTQTAVTRQIN